jgi:hypothetical protein
LDTKRRRIYPINLTQPEINALRNLMAIADASDYQELGQLFGMPADQANNLRARLNAKLFNSKYILIDTDREE